MSGSTQSPPDDSGRDDCPRYQETFEKAGIGIIHVGLDGVFLRVNAAFCGLVGRTEDALVGARVADISHPDDAEGDRAAMADVIAGARPNVRREKRYLRPDDTEVWVEVTPTVVRDASGQPSYLLAFLQDIARRRTAESEAREHLTRIEAFYEEAFEGIGISDRGRMVEVNPRMCELFGYTREELLGITVARLVHPDDLEMVMGRIRSGYAGVYEHRCVHKDGSVRFVEVQGKPIEYQGRAARLTAIHDITERTKAEEEVARWAHLFENAAWGIGISDASGDILERVNPAFAAMHRTSAKVLEGTAMSELYPESARQAVRDGLRIADGTGHHTFRARQRRPDGSEFPVEVDVSVVRDAEGGFMYRAANVQDITRELELQRQLEGAQRMEALGVLAGGIAHDFNNLLAGVMGYAELVQMNLDPASAEHSDLVELLRAARRGKDLVQQILTFSRRAETAKVQVNLCELVKEVHQLLRASIPTTIPIGLTLPTDCSPIVADPTQLHQVVMNLGTNALQALRDSGGRLDFAVERLAGEPGIPGGVRLVVSDTGHGMDEATRARAIEPFFTTRDAGDGSGMGLAVVHGIVRAHSGTLEIDSTPGAGTRVVVTFPGATASRAAVDEIDSHDIRGTERILLVDDEETVARVMARILGTLGYRTTWCCNPEEALEHCRGDVACDLLITDQTMPGMSGTALAAAVHDLRPALPVILCSGYTDAMTVEQAQAFGIEALLWKPVELRALGRAVRRVLDARDSDG